MVLIHGLHTGFNGEVQISPAKSIMSSAPAHPPIVNDYLARSCSRTVPSSTLRLLYNKVSCFGVIQETSARQIRGSLLIYQLQEEKCEQWHVQLSTPLSAAERLQNHAHMLGKGVLMAKVHSETSQLILITAYC